MAAEFSQSELAQAQANQEESQANAQEAQINASRAKSLSGTGAMSEMQINQYMTQAKIVQARLRAAQANVKIQQIRANYNRITAPESGVVSARNAHVGMVVGSAGELFRLIRDGRLEWRAEVPQQDVVRLKAGTLVTVTSSDGKKFQGTVRSIAPTVDVQTRNAIVHVDLPLPSPLVANNSFKAGMFAIGQFQLRSNTTLTLPQQSLVLRGGTTSVMRINPNNTVTAV